MVPRVALLALLSATSFGQAPTEKRVGGAPQWTAAQIASAEAFARRLETELTTGTEEKALAMFDLKGLVDAILQGMDLSVGMLRSVRSGIESGMPTSLRQVVTDWRASSPKFKRVLTDGERMRVRFRFTGANGLSFVDLLLTPHGESWIAMDFDNHAVGVRMSEQTRQLCSIMLAGANEGLLSRLFGGRSLASGEAKALKEMVEARDRGDHTAALDAHARLPKPIQESAVVAMLHVQVLSTSEDTDAYVAALEAAAKRFPPPMFRFMLVDVHFLKKEWKQALTCIDELIASVERDAALLALRASIQLESGDVPGANETATEALRLEPDCEMLLVKALDVFLAAKDWKAVTKVMTALEKTGSYDFHGQLEGEVWAEFVKVPESEPWR